MQEFGKRIRTRWYWMRFPSGLPVTFHAYHAWRVQWLGVFGVQVGTWFVGVVRSCPEVKQLGVEDVADVADDSVSRP